MDFVVTFHSVSSALCLEDVLAGSGACKVVPVPRSLSSSCGYAAMVEGLSAAGLIAKMDEAGVEWSEVHRCITDGKNERYELVQKCG